MKFEREERVAFARIISDLIEADFIVEEDEMESFDQIKDEKDFKITIDMLSEAKIQQAPRKGLRLQPSFYRRTVFVLTFQEVS